MENRSERSKMAPKSKVSQSGNLKQEEAKLFEYKNSRPGKGNSTHTQAVILHMKKVHGCTKKSGHKNICTLSLLLHTYIRTLKN